LLLTLDEPTERFPFRLARSTFRRNHQAIARRCHAARRAKRPPIPSVGATIQVLPDTTPELTDERWERIAPLLPPQAVRIGRPPNDHRTILAGMLWVIRTGASWREVPPHFGPWETVHGRYLAWRRAGIWQQILDTMAGRNDPDTLQLSL
jgi:transposase